MDTVTEMDDTSGRYRTTLYLDPLLATELKALAARTRRSVNSVVIEAIAAQIAAADDRAGAASTGDAVLALRRDLDRLSERVTALDGGPRDRPAAQEPDDAKPRLRPDEVRREARALILERGGAIQHRELLDALQARFSLPGRDVYENLRTILVHPKATGFKLVKGQGYVID